MKQTPDTRGWRLYVRVVIVIVGPIILVASAVIELFKGFKNAFVYAWLDARGVWSEMREVFTTGRFGDHEGD